MVFIILELELLDSEEGCEVSDSLGHVRLLGGFLGFDLSLPLSEVEGLEERGKSVSSDDNLLFSKLLAFLDVII